MEEQEVFAYLEKQNKAALLALLRSAFAQMNARQRQAVFATAAQKPGNKPREAPTPVAPAKSPPKKVVPPAKKDKGKVLQTVEQFRRDSLAQKYYAPFMIDSKNSQHVPEATERWCSQFADLVKKASALTASKDHEQAVACFRILGELMTAVDLGEPEIIVAAEAGSWMIPVNALEWMRAYFTSLAVTAAPEEYAAVALAMIEEQQTAGGVRLDEVALELANPLQKAHLRAELKRRKIRTRPMA